MSGDLLGPIHRCRSRECCSRFVRIGMVCIPSQFGGFTLFLPSLHSAAHDVHEDTSQSAARGSNIGQRARLLQVQYIFLRSPHPLIPFSFHHILNPLSAIRDHVVHPLLTPHSLIPVSFQHAELGSFRQSRRRARTRRGACHSARLPALRLRSLWRVSF
jgi:hypothetical protein